MLRRSPVLLLACLLAGCPSMDYGTALSSRASCIRTSGFGYSVVVTTANADKSAKTDDEVDINPDSCAMKIRNTGTRPPASGSDAFHRGVTTIQTPGTTTVVTPATVQTIVKP